MTGNLKDAFRTFKSQKKDNKAIFETLVLIHKNAGVHLPFPVLITFFPPLNITIYTIALKDTPTIYHSSGIKQSPDEKWRNKTENTQCILCRESN